jgi:citrate lyase beta subunit
MRSLYVPEQPVSSRFRTSFARLLHCRSGTERWPSAVDYGAHTIMFPSIETAQEATRAVAATDSLDPTYVATANAQTRVIMLAESVKGFANVDAIAAIEGGDCLHYRGMRAIRKSGRHLRSLSRDR